MNGRSAVRALAGGLGVAAVLVFGAAAAARDPRRPGPSGREPGRRPAAPPLPSQPAQAHRARRGAVPRRPRAAGGRRPRRQGRPRPRARGRDRADARAAARDPPRPLRRRPAGLAADRGPRAAVGPDDRVDPPGPAARRGSTSATPTSPPTRRSCSATASRRSQSLAELEAAVTCAVRVGDGATGARGAVRPSRQPLLAATPERLLELVRTGACDAALVDATGVGRFVAGHGARCSGRCAPASPPAAGYVVAVTRGGPVAVADVNRALAAHARRRHAAPARAGVARDRPGPPAAARAERRYSAAPPVTGGSALHGNVIHASVRRHT